MDAWASGEIPFQVVNNQHAGSVYAEVVFAFIQEMSSRYEDIEETVYLVELGAGHGRFPFYFLTAYSKLLSETDHPPPRLCYVMTDLVEANVMFAMQHPKLQSFIDAGVLDVLHPDLAGREAGIADGRARSG